LLSFRRRNLRKWGGREIFPWHGHGLITFSVRQGNRLDSKSSGKLVLKKVPQRDPSQENRKRGGETETKFSRKNRERQTLGNLSVKGPDMLKKERVRRDEHSYRTKKKGGSCLQTVMKGTKHRIVSAKKREAIDKDHLPRRGHNTGPSSPGTSEVKRDEKGAPPKKETDPSLRWTLYKMGTKGKGPTNVQYAILKSTSLSLSEGGRFRDSQLAQRTSKSSGTVTNEVQGPRGKR